MRKGRTDRAERIVRRAVEISTEIGSRYEFALSATTLGRIALVEPALAAEAKKVLAEASKAFHTTGAAYEEAIADLVRAELLVAHGQGLASIELVQKIQDRIEEEGTDEDRSRLHSVRVRSDRILASTSVSESNSLSTFNLLLQRIQSAADTGERLNLTLDLLLERTSAERCLLLLQKPESEKLEVRESRRVPARDWRPVVAVARMVVGHTLTDSGNPIYSTSPVRDSRFREKPNGIERIGSLLAIPLRGEPDFSGGIYLDRSSGADPFGQDELDFAVALSSIVVAILRDLRSEEIESENLRLKHRLGIGEGFERIVTQSPRLLKIIDTLEKLKESTATILLQGETGTGKDLFARGIHASSLRRDKSFVTVNCADLSEDVLESELFGHRRGAFTDAKFSKEGLFERANGGTVFIDEIDKASRYFQDTLLRVVDRKEIKPVGATESISLDVRIVCAANRDLRELVEKDRFLKDLYYRLRVVTIYLPPLRQRKEDIPMLAEHFLTKHAQRAGKRLAGFRPEAVRHLVSFDWPGNVRDLEHEIERIVAVTPEGAYVGGEDLSPEITQGAAVPADQGTLAEVVERVEKRLIRDALRKCNGNKSRAARELGLSRRGFLNKLERYQLR